MSKRILTSEYQADCGQCFGLRCVALPYAKSADFAFDKGSGSPCRNLQTDYRCGIHEDLRMRGFKGSTVYECFGAGQKVSMGTYAGQEWRTDTNLAEEMFEVFPIMQQLHEMLYYVDEVLGREEALPFTTELRAVLKETEELTQKSPAEMLTLDVSSHRMKVSALLSKVSEHVRAKGKGKTSKRKQSGFGYLGANLRGTKLAGSSFRGELMIAADLRNSDLTYCDFLGADVRDANLCGANLSGSVFLTQAQINAAIGDHKTRLPAHLKQPAHWS